jgi:hypothetical protein
MHGSQKRQNQNRVSQRAHRARRTDYITTIEERLRQYEADEIHSNVRLQEVARALKADNDRLKVEVQSLRVRVGGLLGEKEGWLSDRKQLEGVVSGLQAEMEGIKGGIAGRLGIMSRAKPDHRHPIVPSTTYTLPTPSARPHPRQTIACPICPDPDPDCPCQASTETSTLAHNSTSLDTLTLAAEAIDAHSTDCGFCNTTEECLCRAVQAEKANITAIPSPPKVGGMDIDTSCGLCEGAGFCACKASEEEVTETSTNAQPMISAVPLRLRARSGTIAKSPLWKLDGSPSDSPMKDAACSGDPSNCEACRDDDFGEYFWSRRPS